MKATAVNALKEHQAQGIEIILGNKDISTFTNVLHSHLMKNQTLFINFLKSENVQVKKNAGVVLSWLFTPMLRGQSHLVQKRKMQPLVKAVISAYEKEKEKSKGIKDEELFAIFCTLIAYIEMEDPNLIPEKHRTKEEAS